MIGIQWSSCRERGGSSIICKTSQAIEDQVDSLHFPCFRLRRVYKAVGDLIMLKVRPLQDRAESVVDVEVVLNSDLC